ncbi:MAG: flavin reductase [Candidatus Caldatribacterium sp.]|uniref:flavin reductase family protein n=1 Tax=Candidatus Caldatribacterium sp. TaxID=2282143 RepID=UPI002991D280|nr:flavin reductase [Candidatus Caldatribacterium sp.]MCX7730397.1 flavin reductase [Candidatus Caldatribacterium sp.]MDW8081432.1 flavin reductase [Candidatus Calescibacterium sp.]
MDFEKAPWQEIALQALHALSNVGGLLLVTQKRDTEKVNVMTIGWALFGIVWGKPIAAVFVRPSRFTYTLLEENPFFTVNVPPPNLAQVITDCGKYSGRDVDKIAFCALTPVYFEAFPVPSISECIASLQCAVVAKSWINPEALTASIRETYYGNDDYHKVYFGEIQTGWRRKDATPSF